MLGCGAFGTAIANVLAENGHLVNLWCLENGVIQSIKKSRINKLYLPGIKLSKNIVPTAEIKDAISDCEFIFEAVPVKYLRPILLQAKSFVNKDQIWVCLSKGIEKDSNLFPSQVIEDLQEVQTCLKIAAISGPTFANDIAVLQLAGVDVGSSNREVAEKVSGLFKGSNLKTAIKEDIIGVQVCGALKNLVAIGVGIIEGFGFGESTKSFMLNECIAQMRDFANIVGAKPETIYGLSGYGDLVATCMGTCSRNLKFGKDLVKEKNLHINKFWARKFLSFFYSIKNYFCKKEGNAIVLPEGVNTAVSVYQIIKLLKEGKIQKPAINMQHDVIFGDKLILENKVEGNLYLFEAICEIIFGKKEPGYLIEVLKQNGAK